MAKILIYQPDGPYSCELDSGAMGVKIGEAFLGVAFVTDSGEKLSVSMRDNGFEVHYTGDFGETGFDAGWTEFKNGNVTHLERKTE